MGSEMCIRDSPSLGSTSPDSIILVASFLDCSRIKILGSGAIVLFFQIWYRIFSPAGIISLQIPHSLGDVHDVLSIRVPQREGVVPYLGRNGK